MIVCNFFLLGEPTASVFVLIFLFSVAGYTKTERVWCSFVLAVLDQQLFASQGFKVETSSLSRPFIEGLFGIVYDAVKFSVGKRCFDSGHVAYLEVWFYIFLVFAPPYVVWFVVSVVIPFVGLGCRCDFDSRSHLLG